MSSRRARLAAALGALLALAGASAVAQTADPPPQATPEGVAQVVLSRSAALLHQQVVLEVAVTHPVRLEPRWEPPPFDGFWPQELPTQGTPMYYRSGAPERTTRFRRALFPTREGELAVAPSRIWLADRDGNETPVAVPGARLHVEPLPVQGQPPGFSGLVGEIGVNLLLDATQAALGTAFELRVDVFGEGNVWDAPVPDPESWFGAAAEVFPAGSQLVTGERDGRLAARQSYRFQIVPTRPGALEIPPWSVSYFDPERRDYAVRSSPNQNADVLAAGEPQSPGPGAAPAAAPTTARLRRAGRIPRAGALAALLAALAGLGIALQLRRRARAVGAPGASSGSGPASAAEPHDWLAEAERESAASACAAALSRAVRAELSRRYGCDAQPLTASEVRAALGDSRAARLLEELDRARFRGEGADRDALLRAARSYLSVA